MKGYIESILNGIAISPNLSRKGQLGASLAIDPDMPNGDSDVRPSGVLRPTQMSKISGTGHVLHSSGFHARGGEASWSRRHSSIPRPRW